MNGYLSGLIEASGYICPFGFARMPKEDLKGLEAANLLQKVCDEAKAHLWFDLEAFYSTRIIHYILGL